ncbi:MAG: DNA primase [Deltaproteobacteria bacterium]|nr:MAG: DNA primase [Deltaproteobacteria bacterium]
MSKKSWDDITAQVKEEADIVQIVGEQVDLRRTGSRYQGLCPFHQEKTPSFFVYGDKQYYKCFGCEETGDVFSFVMKSQGLEFVDALRYLAQRHNIELPERRQTEVEVKRRKKRELLYTVNRKAAKLFHTYLLEAKQARGAREYLKERGVTEELIRQFTIGYAPSVDSAGWNFLGATFRGEEKKAALDAGLLVAKDSGGTYDRFRDRVVFPIYSIGGQVCAFGGRILGEGQPKYLNSPESDIFTKSRSLLGLYQLKEHIRRQDRVILVEGNFDLISLVAHGFNNVVAPLGTALTREQLRLLKRFTENVTLLFDGDEAGRKAAFRAVPSFLAEKMSGLIAVLPSGHDPDTFVRKQGVVALENLFQRAEELPEFVFKNWVEQYGMGLNGKRRIVEELKLLVESTASPLQRSVFLSHFAEKLGMEAAILERHLNTAKPHKYPADKADRSTGAAAPTVRPLSAQQRQLVEFMILHPHLFEHLVEQEIELCLAGGIGETLYRALKQMVDEDPAIDPEDLLTALPEGEARHLVLSVLQRGALAVPVSESGNDQDLEDIIDFLKREKIQRQSQKLMKRILEAQQENNDALLMELSAEKVRLDQLLHN